MSDENITVTNSQVEATKHHIFTVEFNGESYQTCYPEPLSELSGFFDNEEEAWKDLILSRESQQTGHLWSLCDKDKKKGAKLLWDMLGDTPIDDDECLEEDFLIFERGTDREDVWSWFEEYFELSIVEDLQMVA